MPKKTAAPKGKGKVKPKTISPKHKVPLAKRTTKKAVITMEAALEFIAKHGITITENTVKELSEIAIIPTNYKGSPNDTSRHLKILMLQALEKTLGIVTTAAKIVGVHRATHYDWLEQDEEYRDCVQALGDVALDFSEERLLELVKEKHPAAVIFYLKTKGKKRGYIETVHSMNQTFDDNNVHFYLPDNGRDGHFEDAKIVDE